MAYGKYKDFTKRAQSDKVSRDKAFKIASNPKHDGYQRGLASMVFKFFDKKSKVKRQRGVTTVANKSAIKSMSNQQLANELRKPIIRKFKTKKV